MEFVFVVPRTALFPEFYPHGLVPFDTPVRASDRAARGARPKSAAREARPNSAAREARLNSGGSAESKRAAISAADFEAAVAREGFFVERAYAERTPALKQIIPYSIVHCETQHGRRVLSTRRLDTGGETRLHDKHSIGLGGHINPEDLDVAKSAIRNPIEAGTRREIAEELVVNGAYTVRRVGILNDDSNAVGAVHVGVVQVITVSQPVEIREKDQLEGRLLSTDDLSTMLAEGTNFETWSKLLIPHLEELLPKTLAVLA